MSVEEKQTCNMHTKEKEKLGTCCRGKEEQSFLIKTMSGKTSEIQYFKNIESTKAGPETAAERN